MDNQSRETSKQELRDLALFMGGVVFALLTGLIMDCFVDIALFVALFIPLRIYVGGYHMKYIAGNVIVSAAVIITVAFLLRSSFDDLYIMSILASLGVMIHYVLIPQDSVNRRLYPSAGVGFTIIAKVIVTGYMVIATYMVMFDYIHIYRIFASAITVNSISLIAAYVQLRHRKSLKTYCPDGNPIV